MSSYFLPLQHFDFKKQDFKREPIWYKPNGIKFSFAVELLWID